MSLPTNLRRKLHEKDATQAELAEYCVVTQAMISKIINGLKIPSIPLLMRIASFFNCSTDDLLRSTPEAEKKNDEY